MKTVRSKSEDDPGVRQHAARAGHDEAGRRRIENV